MVWEILKNLKHGEKVQCYTLNTGGVGEIMEKDSQGNRVVKQKSHRVSIPEMASLIGGIAKDTIQWTQESHFGSEVPAKLEGLDLEKFNLTNFYDSRTIKRYVGDLKAQRKEWLSQFPTLPREIVESLV